MSCRRGIAILAFGTSLGLSVAEPVSGEGCACTSACGKSWHNSGAEWCYVGKQCKPVGWDSCHDDTVMLHSESKGKDKQTTTESKSLWQRLQDQLKQTEVKEVEEESALKIAEKEVKQEKEKNLEEESALAVAEAKLKNAQQHSSEEGAQLKIVKKHEAQQEAELATSKEQLATSEGKVDTLKKQLRSALEKEAAAEVKAKEAESKEQTATGSVTQKHAEANKLVQEAQQKAEKAEAAQKVEHAKAMKWEATHHEDEATHRQDELKLSDTELKLSGKEKSLLKSDDKARVAYGKFKVTEKAMLKIKTQASESEKKLSAAIVENTKLKDVEQKYIDVQKKLEIAVKQKNKAYAELKPFHDAVQKAVLA